MRMNRTLHIEGSTTSNDTVKLSDLVDKLIVIEEKIDGTDVGISFDDNANICIQTRATNAVAAQFKPLHEWANINQNKLFDLIGDRYILQGQWCYAKHTIFYNNLCHHFLESDIYDRVEERWLSTYRRQELISNYGGDIICSVPILKIGRMVYGETIKNHVQQSFYKTEKWKSDLESHCSKYHYDYSSIMKETDDSILSEGLYIKHEDKDSVLGRYKYVRKQFLDTILNSGSHYKDRQIIPNMVAK